MFFKLKLQFKTLGIALIVISFLVSLFSLTALIVSRKIALAATDCNFSNIVSDQVVINSSCSITKGIYSFAFEGPASRADIRIPAGVAINIGVDTSLVLASGQKIILDGGTINVKPDGTSGAAGEGAIVRGGLYLEDNDGDGRPDNEMYVFNSNPVDQNIAIDEVNFILVDADNTSVVDPVSKEILLDCDPNDPLVFDQLDCQLSDPVYSAWENVGACSGEQQVRQRFFTKTIIQAPTCGGLACGALTGNEVDYTYPCSCGDPVEDNEGNSYGTVEINNQCWLSSDMRNGTMLAAGEAPVSYDGIIQKWCPSNIAANCTTYGARYNWLEAMKSVNYTPADNQGICPDGFHVATDDDWNILEKFAVAQIASPNPQYNCATTSDSYLWPRCADDAGASYNGTYGAGKALKANADDLFGFSSTLGGYNINSGTHYNVGTQELFWTSSISPSTGVPFTRGLYGSYSTVLRNHYSGTIYGFSVRCVRPTGCVPGETKYNYCGIGACSATQLVTCQADGTWPTTCTPGTPTAESCDGVDNDCDGSVDESLSQTKYQASSVACGASCVSQAQTCSGGSWTPVTTYSANSCSVEECSGVCTPGQTRATACGIGACARAGIETCQSDGTWGNNTCSAGSPSTETCNNIDDDCDGSVDESLSRTKYACVSAVCGTAAASETQTCSAGTWSGTYTSDTPCSTASVTSQYRYSSSSVACDSNCDTIRQIQYCQTNGTWSPSNYTYSSCSVAATTDCVLSAPSYGAYYPVGACGAYVAGIQRRDRSWTKTVVTPASCGGTACGDTSGTEADYTLSCGTCTPGATTSTTCGVGSCSSTGAITCQADYTWGNDTCSAGSPVAETCDGFDNDCDGSVDEGIADRVRWNSTTTTCDISCMSQNQTCSGGAWKITETLSPATFSALSCSATTCSAGTYCNNQTCTACGAGYYCTGGLHRASCPAGTYGSTTNLTTSSCTGLVLAGRYSTGGATSNQGNGAIQCGSYGGVGATSIIGSGRTAMGYGCLPGSSTFSSDNPCPSGYFALNGTCNLTCGAGQDDNDGDGTCASTVAGYYSPANDWRRFNCGVGNYCLAGSVSATSCPNGTYGATANLQTSACSGQCLAGYYCTSGSTTNTNNGNNCAAGYYCPVGTATQLPCAAGYSTNGNEGQASCTACAAGTYASGTGNASCTACAAGTYATGTGNTSCSSCLAGTYASGTGNTSCTNCSAGYYSSSGGAIACQTCTDGKWNDAGSNNCSSPCPEGFYCLNQSIYGCASGKWSNAGAAISSSCYGCPYGYYCGGGIKTACSTGKTSPGGSYDSSQCFTCGAGYYSNSGYPCTAAGCGYRSPEGDAQKYACGPGTSSLGLTTSSECYGVSGAQGGIYAGHYAPNAFNCNPTPAPAGAYVNTNNASTYTKCSIKYYQAGTGQTSCTSCSGTHTTLSEGAKTSGCCYRSDYYYSCAGIIIYPSDYPTCCSFL